MHYAEGPQNGPPLVLLHGLSRDWSSFSPLFPELVPRFHVFSVDLRGHGQSGRVKGGYRIVDIEEDLREFLQRVIQSPAALFGHSLGATVAMCAAMDEHKVSAVIAGDPLITPPNLDAMYGPIFSQLHQLLLHGGSQQELARGIGSIQIHFPGISEAIRLEELPGNDESVFLEWARTALCTDPDCLRMTVDRSAYIGCDPEQILPRIACPVLLLQGNPELDALLSDSDVSLVKRLLPRLRHVKFHLLGHGLFMQQPKPILDEVIRFLKVPIK